MAEEKELTPLEKLRYLTEITESIDKAQNLELLTKWQKYTLFLIIGPIAERVVRKIFDELRVKTERW